MYAVHKIQDLQNGSVARKFAQLNSEAIRAIQDRPLLYATQFVRDTESWKKELQNGRLACWICVAPNAKDGCLSLEKGQWVGIHQLHGPLSNSEYNFFKETNLEPELDNFCTRWIAGRLYIKADHRNMDVGSLIHRTSLDYLESQTQSLLGPSLTAGTQRHAKIRVSLTAYHGTASFGMHRAGTLRAVREVTRTEDLDYDGLLDQVPADLLGSEDYTEPVGTLSESVEEVLIHG